MCNYRLLAILLICNWTTTALCACPVQCKCGKKGDAILVGCQSTGLRQLPVGFPSNIVDLSLANNGVTSIDMEQFRKLTILRALYLENNLITRIDESTAMTLKSLPSLFAINLSGNPLDCSCTSGMKIFMEWFTARLAQPLGSLGKGLAVVDGYKTLCAQPETLRGKRLDRLTVGEVCG